LGTAALTIYNESRKALLIMWGYKFNLASETLMLAFIFVAIGFFMGDGRLVPERLATALVGYLIWYYAAIMLGNMGGALQEEVQSGTLEQMYMSPTPAAVIFVGLLLATLAVSTVMVAIVGTALLLLLRITIPVSWQALPVFAITMAGLFGLGYAVAGATIVFKRAAALTNMLTNVMLFMNGALLPVDRLPGWLEVASKALPTTQGIIVMRRVLFEGEGLAATWADGSLQLLAAHTAVLFVGGWLAFRYAQSVAMRRGLLGQY
jgi:ABC-2 type transport system permease protein